MDELIAAMEIQMNLHKVLSELESLRYNGGDVDEPIKSARASLRNNELVIEHLIRTELASVQ